MTDKIDIGKKSKAIKQPWEACQCANCGCLLKWVYDKKKRTWCDNCKKYMESD